MFVTIDENCDVFVCDVQYHCSSSTGLTIIPSGGAELQCLYIGQKLPVVVVTKDWLHRGSILCPACDEICHVWQTIFYSLTVHVFCESLKIVVSNACMSSVWCLRFKNSHSLTGLYVSWKVETFIIVIKRCCQTKMLTVLWHCCMGIREGIQSARNLYFSNLRVIFVKPAVFCLFFAVRVMSGLSLGTCTSNLHILEQLANDLTPWRRLPFAHRHTIVRTLYLPVFSPFTWWI